MSAIHFYHVQSGNIKNGTQILNNKVKWFYKADMFTEIIDCSCTHLAVSQIHVMQYSLTAAQTTAPKMTVKVITSL